MLRFPIGPFLILLLLTISTVLGCGVIPAGQVSTRTFNVSGFTTVPVEMAYAGKLEVSAQIPGIAANSASAHAFVERLVMQTVFDVLESQARSALLPDAIISAIIGQLTVKINYEPIRCLVALKSPTDMRTMIDKMKENCIIVSNTVTGVCTYVEGAQMCMLKNVVGPIPPQHLSISGTLTTTNIIMASWTRMMWQNVLNKALRTLALGSFGSHFFSASANVGGI